MATVTHVKSARERKNSDGTIKPLLICDKCSNQIEIGSAYKHMSIKTGPTSSLKLVRCGDCPTWDVWEYSNSVSARCAQIVHDAQAALMNAESMDDAQSCLQDAVESAMELAEEKREAAQNIEEGFGHSTQQSEELTDLADQLEEWSTSLENADVPEFPDPADAECEECAGSGEITDLSQLHGKAPCAECNGHGHPDEPTEDQLDEWRNELSDISELQDSPA